MPADTPTKPPLPPRQRVPLNAAIPRQAPLPADLVASLAEARPGAAGERDKAESSAPSGPGFVLKVKKPHELAKTILEVVKAVGAVVAIVLGATAMVTKAPAPAVTDVERRVEHVELRVEGKTDQKGASSDGESLSERVTALEKAVRPLVDNRCPWQQFEAAVFDRLGAHGIKVQNCPAPKELETEPVTLLPGRPRPLREHLIKTPMPAP